MSNISKLLVDSLLEHPQMLIKVTTELLVKAVLEGVLYLVADVTHPIPGLRHSVLQIISELSKSGAHLLSDSLEVISPVVPQLLHLTAQVPPLPLLKIFRIKENISPKWFSNHQPGPGVSQDGVDPPRQVRLDVADGPENI